MEKPYCQCGSKMISITKGLWDEKSEFICPNCKIWKKDCGQDDWDYFIKNIMNSKKRFQIDEEMYFYWLEVLPPVFMNKYIKFLPGHEGHDMKVDFGFAEGVEEITVFWQFDGKFFGQGTSKVNRRF